MTHLPSRSLGEIAQLGRSLLFIIMVLTHLSVSAESAAGLFEPGCAQLVRDLLRTDRNMTVAPALGDGCSASSQQCSAYPPGFQLLLVPDDLHGRVLQEVADRYLPEPEIPGTLISRLWGELLSGARPGLFRAIWMCSSQFQHTLPDRLVPDSRAVSPAPARNQRSSFSWLARTCSDMLKIQLGESTAAALDWFGAIRYLTAAAGKEYVNEAAFPLRIKLVFSKDAVVRIALAKQHVQR